MIERVRGGLASAFIGLSAILSAGAALAADAARPFRLEDIFELEWAKAAKGRAASADP